MKSCKVECSKKLSKYKLRRCKLFLRVNKKKNAKKQKECEEKAKKNNDKCKEKAEKAKETDSNSFASSVIAGTSVLVTTVALLL
jgi:hypothetical protein